MTSNAPSSGAAPLISGDLPDVRFDHVSGISWPRSGHHLLVRLLSGYFGPGMVYCEFHHGSPTDRTLGECCRTVPCNRQNDVMFTKNHDFKLDVPQIDGLKYLVQFRDFLPSVVSNFELAVRGGLYDNERNFRIFVSKQFGDYLNFTSKWVTSDFARKKNVLRLPYEDLVAAPEVSLALAVRHLAPDSPPDDGRIKRVVASVDGQKVAQKKVHILLGSGVHNARNVQNFRYYKPQLFVSISQMKLRREDVFACFNDVLGREPAESNMVHFQGFETIDALEKRLMATPEYQNRHGSTPQTPQRGS